MILSVGVIYSIFIYFLINYSMSIVHDCEKCTIISKHFILIFLRLSRMILFLIIGFILFWITHLYLDVIHHDIIHYLLLPIILFIINYAILKNILSLWAFYNNFLIFHNDKIYVFNSSLFLTDDVEIIDIHKIIKISSHSHGVFSNLFWFWSILLEQSNDDIFSINLIPNPHKIVDILEDRRKKVFQRRRERYFVHDRQDPPPPNEQDEE